ncbi:MAG: ferrochelatase [Betaproteobacteria bacterium]|nr:ferrochelatase [Betaproteobacteria bacterium]
MAGAPLRDGVLLVNLGTPEAPTASAVRSYLAEFLSDPRVVELPRVLWLPLLHAVILNLRPKKSAEKYAKVWTKEGSPLMVHTMRQAKLLRGLLGERRKPAPLVEFAMRYGRPSIGEALDRLGTAGCIKITVLPLYPQYAASTTESVRDTLNAWLRRTGHASAPRFIEQYPEDPGYLAALEALVRRCWKTQGRGEKLVMSFHGLPQRAVDRGDPYQRQCYATASVLAQRLDLAEIDYVVTFQSRFGAAKWLQPYTEPTLIELAKQGLGRVDVLCPGFVSDCLETLEEIGIAAREKFFAAGGTELRLMPCLNESPEWIEALAGLACSES